MTGVFRIATASISVSTRLILLNGSRLIQVNIEFGVIQQPVNILAKNHSLDIILPVNININNVNFNKQTYLFSY